MDAHPRQSLEPHAMCASSDTWHGIPLSLQIAATARIMGNGPHVITALTVPLSGRWSSSIVSTSVTSPCGQECHPPLLKKNVFHRPGLEVVNTDKV